jgi:hypothetical protein
MTPTSTTPHAGWSGSDTWWPTPEPPHRINQIYLEPVLFAHAARSVRILDRTRVTAFTQHADGIVAAAGSERVGCEYLVGCDGGRSTVRRAIGSLRGRRRGRARAVDLHPRARTARRHGRARMGDVLAQPPPQRQHVRDRRARDVAGPQLPARGGDRRRPRREPARDLGVGPEFAYEVLAHEDWTGRRLVADRFRDRRAVIAGDAAHMWVPMAGYGMNAGIADAESLAWLLAGVLNGWAAPAALDAYEAERAPPYTMDDFTPSTVPGCRAPHVWLEDGRSLYDVLGPELTLLRADPALAVDGLVAAAARRGVPLAVLDVPYATPLVLVRPDRHVAWRGDAEPADPLALIDRVRGAAADAG